MVKRKRAQNYARGRKRRRRRGRGLMRRRRHVNYRKIIPLKTRRKLVYTTRVGINPAAGGVGFFEFRLNGMFDPEVAIGGHQPMGYDQMMLMYENWMVYKCNVILDWQFQTSNTAAGAESKNQWYVGGAIHTAQAKTYGSLEDRLESRSGPYKYINCYQNAKDLVRQRISVKPWKHLGHKWPSTADLGIVGADPAEESILQVWAQGPDGSVDPNTIFCQVTLVYFAVFSDPLTLGGS